MYTLWILLFSVHIFAQESCDQSANQAQRRCASALGEANAMNSASTQGPSIEGSSNSMIENLQRQNFNLTAAGRYCEALKSQCKKNCGSSADPNSNSSSGSEGHPYTRPDEKCTRAALEANGKWVVCSPLVVQMGQEPLELTPPPRGILYDILGERNVPAHAPVKISWPTAASRGSNHFLGLPAADGAIHGIDQLFGNNTRGPDGHFAENGYAALAKYDLNQDHQIDANDPVFDQLRLWADINGDGKSQVDELTSLRAAGVESIDLRFSNSAPEIDIYGNQIKFKSVVTMLTGELKLIFDLYFVGE